LSVISAKARRPAAPHTPLWTRPGYLIRRLHQNHTAIFAEECKAYGITPVQYGVLTALLHRPNIDQATLGAECGIDRTNAADVIERLAERGLVKRAKSVRDRRMMLAALTPAGRALTHEMHTAMQRAQERLLDALSAGERKRFLTLLLKLVDTIGTSSEPTAAPPSPRRARRNGAARRRVSG
jgi:DNA-binding MarR family transcriptional regulator